MESGASAGARGDRAWARALTALCAGFVALGLAARLAPLFDQGGRLLQQFPTDDGYLMLTVARNLALGHGMSISDGAIPSNGGAPLATLAWAGCFWLVEGVKRSGVALVLAVETLLGAAGALGVERLARLAFAGRRRSALAAALAASAWWASPVALPHSMNGLESQIYSASVIFAALLFTAPGSERAWPLGRQLGFGGALGICFLARCDALFLILAACLVHPFRAVEGRPRGVTRRLAETLVFAAVALAVAAQWLAFNHLVFGSAVPIDVQAARLDAHFAPNARVPLALADLALLVAPIPRAFQSSPRAAIAAAVACAAALVAAALAFRAPGSRRRALLALSLLYTASLAAFYGLAGGAGDSAQRELYPASPFLALGWAWAAVELGARLTSARLTALACALAAGVFGLAAAGTLQAYRSGNERPQFRVLRWLEANAPPDAWIGARRAGTLGFFHDRTLSFDAAANPEALAALERGALADYIAEKHAPYIAGDTGALDLLREPPIRALYKVLVDDADQNLGVLQLRHRRAAAPEQPESAEPESTEPESAEPESAEPDTPE
ncbi:MAG: hypothetical protein ACHQ6T_01910 [Myxococcota bacterium]